MCIQSTKGVIRTEQKYNLQETNRQNQQCENRVQLKENEEIDQNQTSIQYCRDELITEYIANNTVA